MNEHFAELLAVMAHEMRTPIAAILGYQELLAEGIYGNVDPRGQEGLQRIAYSAKQLLHLIDGVQEATAPAGKGLSTQITRFDPKPVLQSCLHNAAADAIGRNVKLDTSISDSLPAIAGDPDKFCRAVDLALAAAIKASHGATLKVSAAANGGLVISIAGTGLQVERDAPGPLIDHRKTRLTGAGLRLAIVGMLAGQMRGSIELVPENAGSTIVLRLAGADTSS